MHVFSAQANERGEVTRVCSFNKRDCGNQEVSDTNTKRQAPRVAAQTRTYTHAHFKTKDMNFVITTEQDG